MIWDMCDSETLERCVLVVMIKFSRIDFQWNLVMRIIIFRRIWIDPVKNGISPFLISKGFLDQFAISVGKQLTKPRILKFVSKVIPMPDRKGDDSILVCVHMMVKLPTMMNIPVPPIHLVCLMIGVNLQNSTPKRKMSRLIIEVIIEVIQHGSILMSSLFAEEC